jgi:hypothetical protein
MEPGAMTTYTRYPVRRFELGHLSGISERAMEIHLKLYEGYVKQANRLTEEIRQFPSFTRTRIPGLRRPTGVDYVPCLVFEGS